MSAFDELERQLRGAASRRRRARLWRTPLLTAGAVVALGGGALALEHQPPQPDPKIENGVTVDERVLALGVPDPRGGAPWALRVSRTNRDAACVEVGRIEGSRFTSVQMPVPAGATAIGNQAVMICGTAMANGLLVRGGVQRWVEPYTLRFGMLGPLARSVRFVDNDGTASTQTPGEGGAYLFVLPRRPPRATHEYVEASFADGTSLRVAGHHASARPLPGADPSPPLPRTTRAKLRVIVRRRVFTVRFASPVKMSRVDEVYRVYLAPPARCRQPIPGYNEAINRDYAPGERIEVPLMPARGKATCHGTYTVTVRYHSSRTGNKHELLVGSAHFTRSTG